MLILLGLTPVVACSYRKQTPTIAPSLKDYNLIFINIDALRPDHLGCYGYYRDTSAYIDSLASEGIVFEQAMSNSSYTRESVAVLFSGRLPSSSGAVGWFAAPPDGTANLGELFRDAGYRTGFFSNTITLKNQKFVKGFDEFQHLPDKWGISREGPRLSERALEFVRGCAEEKFMLYLHYLDPHAPYAPSKEFYLRFAEKEFPSPVHVYFELVAGCPVLIQEGFGPGEARFEDLVLRYDAEIVHIDEAIKMLFQGLRELQVLDSTFVIISADHGEEFIEHGFVEHAWTLYNESLKIPLIFWAPDPIQPGRIPARVSVVDLLPTILELMEIPHSRKDFDGTPLFKRQGDKFHFNPPVKPVIAELLIEERSVVRTIIQDDWKYVAAQRWLVPEERAAAVIRELKLHMDEIEQTEKDRVDIWGPVVHEELYNLRKDPKELKNVRASYEKKRLKLQIGLNDYKSSCQEFGLKRPERQDEKESLTPEERQRMRALGYL